MGKMWLCGYTYPSYLKVNSCVSDPAAVDKIQAAISEVAGWTKSHQLSLAGGKTKMLHLAAIATIRIGKRTEYGCEYGSKRIIKFSSFLIPPLFNPIQFFLEDFSQNFLDFFFLFAIPPLLLWRNIV